MFTSLSENKKLKQGAMDIESKSIREELKKTQKVEWERGWRGRPFDKVSTLSVDGMTMTPLQQGRFLSRTQATHKGAGSSL